MTFNDLTDAPAALHLRPLGGFHDAGTTTVLLGPLEPGFWSYVSQQPEFKRGGSDPLDAWSHSAITALGQLTNSSPLFPFGGPPHHPFIAWTLRCGAAWQSPVGLLVHKDAGLLVSYRGALVFDQRMDLPQQEPSPCASCVDQPCIAACPAQALTPAGYDVPSCKAYIDTDPICGAGCRVRMACPLSQTYPRAPDQTAFHMKAFHPT